MGSSRSVPSSTSSVPTSAPRASESVGSDVVTDLGRSLQCGIRPILAGTLLAVVAALSFGAKMPLLERAGRGVGPFTTAALLYLGACVSALVLGGVWRSSGAKLGRPQLGRLALVALF